MADITLNPKFSCSSDDGSYLTAIPAGDFNEIYIRALSDEAQVVELYLDHKTATALRDRLTAILEGMTNG